MASDDPLLGQVVGLAGLTGWRVTHFRPAWTKKGMRTAISGDPGFPDLALAKAGQVFFLEVKSRLGYPTAAQLTWIKDLPLAFVVRPEHFEFVKYAMRKQVPELLYQHCALAWDVRQQCWVGSLAKWATGRDAKPIRHPKRTKAQ